MALGYETRNVTIANGVAASGAFSLEGRRIAGVVGPTAWTAADITFLVDPGDGTFRPVVGNDGAIVKITGVATSASEVMIPPEIADQIVGKQAKINSTNTASEADVTQGAARSLIVLLVPLTRE